MHDLHQTGKQSTEKKRLPVAFASDDKGVLMLGIALYSMLASAGADTRYIIYVLEDEISEENRAKLQALQVTYDCELHLIPVHHLISKYACTPYKAWPATMYARFFLPTLLHEETRVLYMDIDTLILSDLGELLATPTEDNVLAGVVYEEQNADLLHRKQQLGLLPKHRYFNSGVMLMELERMRSENLGEQCLTYLRDHINDLTCPDQDVLNAVLRNRVWGMHPRWNWPAWFTKRQILSRASNWGELGVDAACQAALHPSILHFWGYPKPTEYNYHYHRQLYRDIWLNSPWSSIPYSGRRRLRAALKRLVNLPTDWLTTRKIRHLSHRLLP